MSCLRLQASRIHHNRAAPAARHLGLARRCTMDYIAFYAATATSKVPRGGSMSDGSGANNSTLSEDIHNPGQPAGLDHAGTRGHGGLSAGGGGAGAGQGSPQWRRRRHFQVGCPAGIAVAGCQERAHQSLLQLFSADQHRRRFAAHPGDPAARGAGQLARIHHERRAPAEGERQDGVADAIAAGANAGAAPGPDRPPLRSQTPGGSWSSCATSPA